MILPELEANAHGVDVVGMFFFEDNNYVLVRGSSWASVWRRSPARKGCC